MVKIAISTSTFYNLDFMQTLKVIKKAGYDYIELTPYWIGGDWEIAQHLKHIKPSDSLKMINDNGLKISSIHDCGGTILDNNQSFIADIIYEYQDLTDSIECVVLHTPHRKTDDINWWDSYKLIAMNQIKCLKYKYICFENLTPFDDYVVPFTDPYELKEFVEECNCYVNIDINHYGQVSYDIIKASNILKDNLKSIHLSDYSNINKRYHTFPGEGDLDLTGFFGTVDFDNLYSITSECNIRHDNVDMDKLVDITRRTKEYIEDVVGRI